MLETVSRIKQQILEFWSKLEKAQKAGIIVTFSLLFVSLTIAIVLATRPSYETLLSGADPQEIGEISKILDEKGIWNQPSDRGTSIIVKSSDMGKAQAAMVQEGYPKSSSMTFDDAFGKIKLNSTESDKQWLRKEYAESKLASNLKLLDNVEDARVTINVPEKSIFVKADNQFDRATASVVIKPRTKLTAGQIQGIVRMVAASVENLDPKDIVVVDTEGNILNSEDNQNDIDKQFDQLQRMKNLVESNVRNIFQGQFEDFDRINVAAHIVLDNDTKTETRVEYFLPEGSDEPLPRSLERTEEKLTNPQNNAGAPGTDTNPGTGNIPVYQTTATNQGGSYSKTTLKQNLEINQTNTTSVKATGNIDTSKSSLTLSVIYGINALEPPSTEKIMEIKEAASTASGIPVERISVVPLKYSVPETPAPTRYETFTEILNNYGYYALMLILVIALLISLIPRRSPATVPEMLPEELYYEEPEDEERQPKFVVPEPKDEWVPPIDLEERSEVKKQIDRIVKQKPDAVAQLLRNWLTDDWD